jgi:hypothetical protein
MKTKQPPRSVTGLFAYMPCSRYWRVMRFGWLFSTGGVVFTLTSLFIIYFLLIPIASADVLSLGSEAANVLETAVADGGVVKLLLTVLCISVSTQAIITVQVIRFMFETISKPCVMKSRDGIAMVRDVLREVYKDARRRERDSEREQELAT